MNPLIDLFNKFKKYTNDSKQTQETCTCKNKINTLINHIYEKLHVIRWYGYETVILAAASVVVAVVVVVVVGVMQAVVTDPHM